ncbi:Outer membrane protein TolC [Dyadobacter koreensis]|uniref:Outer membrane protein TolC n=1 Tax=Dyadobacter koreensis TaxID=408657 RepID=A0A1H6YUR1_9BACT|nr:TolC family protein [Dyadobacter koreensis]SEJ42747.1 Outer membrane protein TolC [Dyadobacter koreensis]
MYYHQKYLSIFLLSSILGLQPVVGKANCVLKDTIKLSLRQVWQQAETYNKSVQIRQLEIRKNEEKLKNARAERLPEIKSSTKYARVSDMPLYENGIFNKPLYGNIIHNYFQLNAEASMVLYNGEKIKTRIKEGEVERDISTIEKDLTASDIKFKATAFYLELERNKLFKDLILVNIEEQKKRLDQMRELFKNGVILRSDVLRAELHLSRQQMLLTEIENTIQINNQKLAVLIGLPEETEIKPEEDILTADNSSKIYDDYLTEALSHAFGIRISEKEMELKTLELKEIKSNALPKVVAYTEYGYTYPQILFYPYEASLYGLGQAGIKVSYTLSSLYQNNHKVKAAEISIEKQHLAHKDEEDALKVQVNEAYVRYKESLQRIEVSEQNIRQAKETYRIVYNTYFNQLALLTDLLDADTQLLQSRFDMTTAQIRARLEYYYLMKTIGEL